MFNVNSYRWFVMLFFCNIGLKQQQTYKKDRAMKATEIELSISNVKDINQNGSLDIPTVENKKINRLTKGNRLLTNISIKLGLSMVVHFK